MLYLIGIIWKKYFLKDLRNSFLNSIHFQDMWRTLTCTHSETTELLTTGLTNNQYCIEAYRAVLDSLCFISAARGLCCLYDSRKSSTFACRVSSGQENKPDANHNNSNPLSSLVLRDNKKIHNFISISTLFYSM